MQVFIVGSPLETAMVLDKKRLNRQIQEAQVILDALNGAKAWSNHPCTLQYRGHEKWLMNYMGCLIRYRCGEIERAATSSTWCELDTPPFHTQTYFDNMKSRLFTKDPVHYAEYAEYGTSDTNMYFVDGEWRYYKNGKRVKENI